MKFKIDTAGGDIQQYEKKLQEFNYKDGYVELVSAEDFINLTTSLQQDVIISYPFFEDDEPNIRIYDDYLE
ncbi:MAG: hypothetical protein ACI35O_10280 [Bacillaceae bacterium]